MHFFSIEHIAFEILGYPISYIELMGTLFGLLSVYLASKANILTWPTGIVNEFFLFLLFFQIQLYADMFLQLYFFVITIYGWHQWNQKSAEVRISRTGSGGRICIALIILSGTLLSGFLLAHVHVYFPSFFPLPAAYPFVDSFIMLSSIMATILLARKKIESWYLWIIIDLVCVVLYFQKEVLFLSLEYFIFLGLATYGLLNWRKGLIYA